MLIVRGVAARTSRQALICSSDARLRRPKLRPATTAGHYERLQPRLRSSIMSENTAIRVAGSVRGAKRRGPAHLLSRPSSAPEADSEKEKAPKIFGRFDPDVVALVLVYFIQGALCEPCELPLLGQPRTYFSAAS